MERKLPIADLTYRAIDSMFIAFYPNTPAGETAWNVIATNTDGTGKVANAHVESTIQQLREAGYSVTKGDAQDEEDDDKLLAALVA